MIMSQDVRPSLDNNAPSTEPSKKKLIYVLFLFVRITNRYLEILRLIIIVACWQYQKTSLYEWLFFERSAYFISFQVIINVYILEIVKLF